MSEHGIVISPGDQRVLIQVDARRFGIDEAHREALELHMEAAVLDGMDLERTFSVKILRWLKTQATNRAATKALDEAVKAFNRRRSAFRKARELKDEQRHDGCQFCAEAFRILDQHSAEEPQSGEPGSPNPEET